MWLSPNAHLGKAPRRFVEMALAVAIGLMLVVTTSWWATPAGESVDDLEGDTESLFRAIGARGLTVIEIGPEGSFTEVHRGVTGTGEPVDASSVFVWGSVSKPITALLIRQLEAADVLRLDQPVSRYLPELEGSELDNRGVVLNDLVNHTSGLPHDLMLTDQWDRRTPARQSLWEVAAIADLEPRGKFRYSSLNYLVLQAVVEAVRPVPYGVTFHEFVVSTTGATGIATTPEDFLASVPPGFVPFFWGEQEVATGVDSAGFGYGYLSGGSMDLAQVSDFLLADRRLGLADMDQVVDRGVPATGGTLYADGWYIDEVDIDETDRTLINHSGAVPGYYSHVALVPEEGLGFVILANRYGEVEATQYAEAARAFVLQRLGQETTTESSRLHVAALTILGALVLALLALTVWQVARIVGRPATRRPYRWALARCLLAAAIGFGFVAAVTEAPKALLDISASTAMPWAPDIVLLVWLLLGQILLSCALFIVREVSAFAGRPPAHKRVRTEALVWTDG